MKGQNAGYIDRSASAVKEERTKVSRITQNE